MKAPTIVCEIDDERTRREAGRILIGIVGGAGYGKDTFGGYLRRRLFEYYDVKPMPILYAFADPVKKVLSTLFNWGTEHLYGSLKDRVDPVVGVSPRQAMQSLGTGWGRNTISAGMWIDMAERVRSQGGLHGAVNEAKLHMIVTDVRMENEAAWIRANGGTVVHLPVPHRPSPLQGDTEEHETEQGIYVGDPRDYRVEVEAAAGKVDLEIGAIRFADWFMKQREEKLKTCLK